MRPIVTDGVAPSVNLSVTIMSRAKTTEPIEVPLGVWTRVGPKKARVRWGCTLAPSGEYG